MIHHTRKRIYRTLTGGTITFIGYMLSPLSWWNDMLINIPLAFGFAYLIGLLISPFVSVHLYLFLGLMAVGYFLTNVLGFLLMQHGARHMLATPKETSFDWRKNLAYSFVAFLLTVGCIQLGILDLGAGDQLMASVLRIPFIK